MTFDLDIWRGRTILQKCLGLINVILFKSACANHKPKTLLQCLKKSLEF